MAVTAVAGHPLAVVVELADILEPAEQVLFAVMEERLAEAVPVEQVAVAVLGPVMARLVAAVVA